MSEQEPPPPTADQPASSVSVEPPPPPQGFVPPSGVGSVAPNPVIPLRTEKPVATWADIGLLSLAGFFGNLAIRTSLGSMAAFIGVVFVGIALTTIRRASRDSIALVALALLISPWLFIRSADALTVVTIVTIIGLLAAGAGFSRIGSIFDSRVRDFAGHVGSIAYEWMYGSAMVQRLARSATSGHKMTSLARGIAVAIPVLFVFTALLASADEVFAQVLLLDNIPSLIGHLLLTGFVAIAALALVSRAAHETPPKGDGTVNMAILGPVEIAMILGSLVVLFGAFVVTQVVVATGGASHVLETEGLTQASHARSGFFQLLWVSGLAVALLGALRAVRVVDPERGKDRFRPLALVTLLLTLLIAAVSMQRLALYVGSFGFTPLRLWALVGTGLVSVIIVLFALSIAGWNSTRSWFPGAVVVLSALVVFGLNAVNPDAVVANYNLNNQLDGEIDITALANLSDDAIPALVDGIDELERSEGENLARQLCTRYDRATSYGVLQYNRASVRADALLDELCLDARVARPVGDRWGD